MNLWLGMPNHRFTQMESHVKDWAELARTVVAGASAIDIGIVGRRAPVARHATDGAGALLFALEEVAPECAHLVRPGQRGPLVDATASDVSSVAHPGRVRGRVELTGRAQVMTEPVCDELLEHLGLTEGQPVARLVPDTITLEWSVECGATRPARVDVAVAAYVAAEVDPLAGWQDGWITHLDGIHREDLRRLVEREVQPVATVRPVLADADGLVLREYVGTCRRDIRVDWSRPVGCGYQAQAALRSLLSVTARG